MITIDQRTSRNGSLSEPAAAAVVVLWRSHKFSTADIAELLTIPEHAVDRLVTVRTPDVSYSSTST